MTSKIGKTIGKQRYWIAAFCCLAYFVAFLDRSNIGVLIADRGFTDALGITQDKAAQGSLMSAFLFWYGVSCFFTGPIVQKIGPHKALIFGLFIWAGLTAVMGMVNLLVIFLLCRALLGLGESVLGPSVASLIQAWFPKSERTTANGAWFVALKVAQIVATPILAWWIYLVGWEGSFYILAVIGLVPLVIAMYYVCDHPSQSRRISAQEKDYIVSGGGASAVENRKTDYGFLKSANFWYIAFVYAFVNMGTWGFMSWVPSFLKTTLGFSWAAMGSLATLPYLSATLSVVVLSPLMDKFNRRALFTLICCAIFALSLGVAMTTESRMVAVAVLSLSLAFGAPVSPAVFTMVQNITNKNQVAAATGVLNGVGYVFASISPMGMGILADMTGSLRSGFVGLGVASAIAFLLCIPLVRQRL